MHHLQKKKNKEEGEGKEENVEKVEKDKGNFFCSDLDDHMILDYAAHCGGVVVSRDNYRDHADVRKTLALVEISI